jgi:hypothetical protein
MVGAFGPATAPGNDFNCVIKKPALPASRSSRLRKWRRSIAPPTNRPTLKKMSVKAR